MTTRARHTPDASLIVCAENLGVSDGVVISTSNTPETNRIRVTFAGRDSAGAPVRAELHLTPGVAGFLAEDLLTAIRKPLDEAFGQKHVLRHRACGGKVGELQPDGKGGLSWYGQACEVCRIPVQRENCYESDT